MAKKFIGKILKFANHLAADYYTRDQGNAKKPEKRARDSRE